MSAPPVILDGCCGPGGAAKGYQQAGFYVIGIDTVPQPSYCGDEFYQMDVMPLLEQMAAGRWPLPGPMPAAVHCSFPCQAFTTGAPGRKRPDHPDLLTPGRGLLKATGLPYVIENVPNAPMPSAHLFCGVTFGLPLIRHRLFEISPDPGLIPSLCPQSSRARGVTHGPGVYAYAHGKWRQNWRDYVLPVVWPWMEFEESGQAVPPAYTEYIGRGLLEHLAERAA